MLWIFFFSARVMAKGLVGISAALYFFQLLCFIMPVNRHKTLQHGSLLATENLEGLKERWKSGFTAKPALNVLNEFAARAVNMAGNQKVKLSKHTTSTLAYCLCLSLLLSSGKYYFQNESECFIGVSKHRETNESTRPQAECFYCFEVFGYPDETRSTSFGNNFSRSLSNKS